MESIHQADPSKLSATETTKQRVKRAEVELGLDEIAEPLLERVQRLEREVFPKQRHQELTLQERLKLVEVELGISQIITKVQNATSGKVRNATEERLEKLEAENNALRERVAFLEKEVLGG